MLVLVPIRGAEDAGDVVSGPDNVDAPIVAPTLATGLDVVVEFVAFETISMLVILASIIAEGEPNEVPVVPVAVGTLWVVMLLVAPSPSALAAARYAAASALLTAACDILYFVASHAVCIVCNGAMRNSG